MAYCSKCNRVDIKCCTTCKKDVNKCEIWHHCGSDCPEHESGIITNADRIRAMTDEELAEFFYGLDHYWDDGHCVLSINDNYLNDCKDDILDWLQSEAEQKGE